MPGHFEKPVCYVNTAQIRHLSTSSEDLHGMWSSKSGPASVLPSTSLISLKVFSKCGESLQDGPRLENLFWRMWKHETLCSSSLPLSSTTNPASRPKKADVPHLSASVDSLASEELEISHFPTSKTIPVNIQQPVKSHQPPCSILVRGSRRHISPQRVEEMVESIQEKQSITALSPTIVNAVPSLPVDPPSPPPTQQENKQSVGQASLRSSDSSTSTAPLSSPDSDRSIAQTMNSDTSAECLNSQHSIIIRGFSPQQPSSSYRSSTHLAPARAPVRAPTKPIMHTKNVEAAFMLGASSGEEESSFEEHIPSLTKQSSLTAGLKKPTPKKQALFKEDLISNRSYEDEEVFVSDEEDSSAIDDSEDEDEENWEEASESEDNVNDARPLFQRVDSKPDLVSRRSLITKGLTEGDRQTAFAEMAQAQPALRKAKTQVKLDAQHSEPLMLAPQMKRSKPINAVSTNSQAAPIAFSPRTTRRNMLATEMTESLRKAVLFERQQKKATATAVMKRRHTAQELTQIRDYPEGGGDAASKENRSWNEEFSSGVLGDYHQTGW